MIRASFTLVTNQYISDSESLLSHRAIAGASARDEKYLAAPVSPGQLVKANHGQTTKAIFSLVTAGSRGRPVKGPRTDEIARRADFILNRPPVTDEFNAAKLARGRDASVRVNHIFNRAGGATSRSSRKSVCTESKGASSSRRVDSNLLGSPLNPAQPNPRAALGDD